METDVAENMTARRRLGYLGLAGAGLVLAGASLGIATRDYPVDRRSEELRNNEYVKEYVDLRWKVDYIGSRLEGPSSDFQIPEVEEGIKKVKSRLASIEELPEVAEYKQVMDDVSEAHKYDLYTSMISGGGIFLMLFGLYSAFGSRLNFRLPRSKTD